MKVDGIRGHLHVSGAGVYDQNVQMKTKQQSHMAYGIQINIYIYQESQRGGV